MRTTYLIALTCSSLASTVTSTPALRLRGGIMDVFSSMSSCLGWKRKKVGPSEVCSGPLPQVKAEENMNKEHEGYSYLADELRQLVLIRTVAAMSGSEVRELLEKREVRERERIKNRQEMAVAREQLEILKQEKDKLQNMKKRMKRMKQRMLRDQLQLQKLQENKEQTEALLVQHKTLNSQLRADSTKEKKEAADREVLICCERDEFKGLVQVAEQQLDISYRLAQDQSEEAASASQRAQDIRDECVEKGGWSRVSHRTAEGRTPQP
jgi:DNA repair exonuclease SbcCD ATPase subunit